MQSETCTLVYVTNEKNENSFPVQITETVEVFCREKSAVRTEFYDALRSGIKIALVLEIRPEDWELTGHRDTNGKKQYATKVIYDGGTYDIVRAYRNDKSLMQIICS